MHGRWPSPSRSPQEGASTRLKCGGLAVSGKISLMEGVLILDVVKEGMHGNMRENGTPPVDQGGGEGLAQHGWGLAGFLLKNPRW